MLGYNVNLILSIMPTPAPTRRSFLKSALAASTAPMILPSGAWSAEVKPNDRLTMGFIGVGKQNRGLLNGFIGRKTTEVLAVCDVDTTRRERALQTVEKRYADRGALDGWKGGKAYSDFRELIERRDIDAVCIATPDHWHAIITIAALDAGKDVYCEKPLTHNIHEAKAVIEAVKRNNRVLQTGSMQRSMTGFRTACELVQNGCIGDVVKVVCNFGPPGVPCNLPAESMEPGLDWDRWLGPAQGRSYNSVLSPRGNHDHFPSWRDYKVFGGGMVTDWGAHHLDIAQWGIGMDESGPVRAIAPEDPKATKGAKLIYANGIVVEHGESIGVHFFGTEGEVQVTRGGFSFKRGDETIAQFLKREDGGSLESAVIKAEKAFLKDPKIKLYKSSDHLRDFLECVVSRKKPITHEGIGGRSAICCHLMNQAYYHREKLAWDPAANVFAEGTGNQAWLTREYRGPWSVA
jgi:predicted dehydrogenase